MPIYSNLPLSLKYILQYILKYIWNTQLANITSGPKLSYLQSYLIISLSFSH